MKKLVKKDHKGFTLVEVIVVLVILAIMAAVLIPSLIGYIDKSRENSIISETRSLVTAVQSLASEKYGENNDAHTVVYTLGASDAATVIAYSEVEALCELKNLDTNVTDTNIEGGKVKEITYKSGDKQRVYNEGKYTVSDAA